MNDNVAVAVDDMLSGIWITGIITKDQQLRLQYWIYKSRMIKKTKYTIIYTNMCKFKFKFKNTPKDLCKTASPYYTSNHELSNQKQTIGAGFRTVEIHPNFSWKMITSLIGRMEGFSVGVQSNRMFCEG